MSGFFGVNSWVVALTLWVLVALSVTTWSITLLKLWQRWQLRQRDAAFAQAFWSVQEWQQAARVEAGRDGDLGRLAQAGFTELQSLDESRRDLQHTGSPQELLERQLRQTLQNIQRYHERGLAELASIGSTSPFVGLFGTVWGIMHALQDIGASGSASLDVVAGPIGEALIATAIGIATALPAVLAYNYFLRQLKVHMTDLENFAHDFMRLAQKHDYKL